MQAARTIIELENEIREANAAYWERNAPSISDYEFDALVRELRERAPDSAVLLDLGSRKPQALGDAVTHREPMLSLDKCYTDAELQAWAAKVQGGLLAIPKYDGIACSLIYGENGQLKVAATRGDGAVGDNITVNARAIADIPKQIPAGLGLEVRGEIYMRLSVFERFKAEGKSNPRNLAAGAIKQKDAAKSADYALSFAGYDIPNSTRATLTEDLHFLNQVGFAAIDFSAIDRDQLAAGYARFAEQRAALDYEIDGVVYKADVHTERSRLGATSHHPNYAIAYKFQGDSGVSVLREIEWSVARTGAITPVAIVDPVNLSGVSVSRASLHNVAFIDKLGLTIGASVTLIRRGGVIPNLEFVNSPGPTSVAIPTACPSCGEPVVRERDFLYCTKPASCKRAVLGQLGHFASAIDILGFGESLLEQAYDAGILRTHGDFYRLTTENLAKLPKLASDGQTRKLKDGSIALLGNTVAAKVMAELDKKRSLDLATFLRALGLPEIGKNVSKLLADKYGELDAVLAAEEAELGAVHGVGEVIAKSVVQGLAAASASIADLRAQIEITYERKTGGEGPLKGLSFVFTGKMVAFARSEGEKRVREAGGEVLSAVTKALTYLVIGDDKSGPKSSKEKAAGKLLTQGAALKILSETEFLALIQG